MAEFDPPKVSPSLDRWADFPSMRHRIGVRLARPSHIRVPVIIQAGDPDPGEPNLSQEVENENNDSPSQEIVSMDEGPLA